jgi:DNA-directed RNA polymerase specialized sigma24 family protein
MTFEEFAAAQLPAVLRFAAVLAGDRAAAEDLAQEVLTRAYSRWDTIGRLDRPEFYVRKMILNESNGVSEPKVEDATPVDE